MTLPASSGRIGRTLAYVRVSDERSDLENQGAAIRAEIGGEPDRVYSDEVSGWRCVRRPGLDSLLTDAKGGKLRGATLYIFALSRLSRKGVRDTLASLDELRAGGVAVRSVTETWLDTSAENPWAEVLIAIFSTVAKLESIAKSDRLQAWAERKRARGERMGRLPRELDLEHLRDLHVAGRSLRAMARAVGASPSTVRKRLRAMGLAWPPKAALEAVQGSPPARAEMGPLSHAGDRPNIPRPNGLEADRASRP